MVIKHLGQMNIEIVKMFSHFYVHNVVRPLKNVPFRPFPRQIQNSILLRRINHRNILYIDPKGISCGVPVVNTPKDGGRLNFSYSPAQNQGSST